jgi:hypothetical protein
MKRLTEDLKRMLAGLAYQDAGDYLSTPNKCRLLGHSEEIAVAVPAQKPVSMEMARHRIALVSDGRDEGAPLDYAIESALRQQAQIDLLLHGGTDERTIGEFEKRLQQAGIPYRCIWLTEPAVEDLADYMARQASLIFLVAMPDDELARVLLEEVIPNRADRIVVPLVLIDAKPCARSSKRSAA